MFLLRSQGLMELSGFNPRHRILFISDLTRGAIDEPVVPLGLHPSGMAILGLILCLAISHILPWLDGELSC